MSSTAKYLRQNLLGLVAIVLALSGGAYAVAATTIDTNDLATGAVNSRVVENGAIKTKDLKQGAVGPQQLKLPQLSSVLQSRVRGECTGGAAIRGVLEDGQVVCVGPGPDGTITGVVVQDGLTGGGTSGSVDIGVDPTVIQKRVTGTCTGNQGLVGVLQDGGASCGSFVKGVTAGTGLTGGAITDTGTIAIDPAQTQRRVSGTCPGTTAVQGVSDTGTVTCTPSLAIGTGSTLTPGFSQANNGQSSTFFTSGGFTVLLDCTSNSTAVLKVRVAAGNAMVLVSSSTAGITNVGTFDNANPASIASTTGVDSGQVNAMINTGPLSGQSLFFSFYLVKAGAGSFCQSVGSGLSRGAGTAARPGPAALGRRDR